MFWARLASFCQIGLNSEPLMVSKYKNVNHGPNVQEKSANGSGDATGPLSRCSKVKCVFNKVIVLKQRMHQITESVEFTRFLGQTS